MAIQAQSFTLKSNLISIENRSIYFAEIRIENGIIAEIQQLSPSPELNEAYLLPGFVDAHVHIESSMLTPVQFARLAVVHGTVGTVSDPHEIANVLGVAGVEYMIENATHTPFKFCWGAPSCVPATVFETAGAIVFPADVRYLLQKPEVGYLAEVMNFPGVLNGDPDMLEKIAIAQQLSKPIDGHAPGLRGEAALRYAKAGCQTDHECFTANEAQDKLNAGMKILIREGSAAKNFEALIELLPQHFQELMFCSDDKHPDNLVEGHINQLVKRALAKGYNLFDVLQVACINPVKHYKLPIGLLQVGDPADFIVLNNLSDCTVLQTYINGQLVAQQGKTFLPSLSSKTPNKFAATKLSQLPVLEASENQSVRVIEALDGQLITNEIVTKCTIENHALAINIAEDILKIVVLNRYEASAVPSLAFIRNFGLKHGAIASTVAHDSHNIIAVGTTDSDIIEAINILIEQKGGVSAVGLGQKHLLPLPVAGLMSQQDGYWVAQQYHAIDAFAKELGSTLTSPFMTLSFMALLVIPSLKISDKGLFDGKNFRFTTTVASN